MSRPIIACDVDLTVVDTGREHWQWLCEEVGTTIDKRPFPEGESLPYNLGDCFGIPERAMDFWRQEDLYDHLKPVEGCVEVLDYLSKEADIIFVSIVKGYHLKSKWRFLDKYFPFLSGYVVTKEKKYARCDILIDDRVSHLANMPDGVKTFLIETPYEQDEEYKDFKPTLSFKSWEEVGRRINATT